MPVQGALGGAYQPGTSTLFPEVKFTENGTIVVKNSAVTITGTAARTLILPPPTVQETGTVLVITAGSAFAHVITATGLLENGVTGGAKTTATFAAFVGSTMMLIASQQKWNVIALNAVVIT